MGQRITVRDDGTPVYLGEGYEVRSNGNRISYLEYVGMKCAQEVRNAEMIAEDAEDAQLRIEGCYDGAYHELANAYVWYEDGVSAALRGIIRRELTALADTVVVKSIMNATGKAINKAVKTYLAKRFKAYSKVFPEIISLQEFSKVTYSYEQADARFKLRFKLAQKWAEKLDSKVVVRVYTRNNKPAFAVAYGYKSKDKMYNSEFVMIDRKYAAHTDYFQAAVHADIGVMDPSINRTLKKLREDWKALKAQTKQAIAESVEEAYANGTYMDKRRNVVDAYIAGVCTFEDADAYLEELDLCGFDVDGQFMLEEVDYL